VYFLKYILFDEIAGNRKSESANSMAAAEAAALAATTGDAAKADGDAPAAATEELTGLAKWQADNQRQSTKVWQPLERCKMLLERVCEDPFCVRCVMSVRS